MSMQDVRRAVDAAPHVVPSASAAAGSNGVVDPEPLHRELPTHNEFPLDALGELANGVRALVEFTQAPTPLCANTVLATAALAAQAHYDVEPPHGGLAHPISIYCVTVADSGERKTTADNLAMRRAQELERAAMVAHAEEMRAFQVKRDAWKRATDSETKALVKSGLRDPAEIAYALENVAGPEPQQPPLPLLTAPDPTIEGMHHQFRLGRPSMGLFSEEGGQLVGGFGMNPENRIKSAAWISSAWGGQPMKRVRATDGTSVLYGRRLSCHLLIQPVVAADLLGDETLHDQGLLSRILIAHPPSLIGKRPFKPPSPAAIAWLEAFHDRIGDLLSAPMITDELGGLTLPALELDAAARERWITYHDRTERALAEDGQLRPIAAFGAKLAEHALRIAAVMAVYEGRRTIDEEVMIRGCRLADYYASEWQREVANAGVTRELATADELTRWIKAHWSEPVISLPDIYRGGPSALRTKDEAQAAVDTLVAHGHLKATDAQVVAGSHRRKVYRIVQQT